MKNTALTLFLASIAISGFAQTSWSTDLNSGSNLKLGTASPDNLIFYSNNTEGMSLSSAGQFKINALAGSDKRMVYVDVDGSLRTIPGDGNPYAAGPCVASAFPWFNGGNYYPTNNRIGTCSSEDFILKANNQEALFIKANSYIGIGLNNGNPATVLDISDGTNASNVDHTKIFGDANGRIETTNHMNLVSNNNMSLSSANNTSIFFNTANTSTDFAIHSGPYAPGTSQKFTIKSSGRVGIGTTAPTCKLQVADANAAEINVYTTNGSQARLSLSISSGACIVSNDAVAAHIAVSTSGGERNLLNLKYNSTYNGEQVWIGTTVPTTGVHADYKFAVDGKIFGRTFVVQPSGSDAISVVDASNVSQFKVTTGGTVYSRELIVTLGAYPDYVFDKSYKLEPLADLEAYIKANHHLPNVPSAKEIEKNGANLGELNKIQMEKIEELTLYILELEKRMSNLEKANNK